MGTAMMHREMNAMNQYRLAICEDDVGMQSSLCDLCKEILTGMEIPHEITLFPCACALEAVLAHRAQPFSLLILDIQMAGMTGMELAHILRKRGDEVSILFVTACPDYLLEGYEVRPVHYLLKPVTRETLEKVLRTDWELHHAPRTVVMRAGGKAVSLTLADIRYVESRNHNLVVHQPGEELSFLMPLSEAERLLPHNQFARCHNSFLVNLSHVKLVGRSELTLRDGQRIPVGRRYYDSFQSAFVRYMNG